MTRSVIALSTLLTAVAPAPGGEFNKALSVGNAAPAWVNLEGTDGKTHSLADLKADVVVVVFTCNSCPIAAGYEDRIIAFAKKYEGKVAVIAINVNTIKEDQLPEMKKRATKKQFPFHYLFDPSQEIAKKYGALYTPEFFVLDRDRKVAYLGAMDEKSPPAAPGTLLLEEAVEAVLAGKKPATAETRARGCKIRFNK